MIKLIIVAMTFLLSIFVAATSAQKSIEQSIFDAKDQFSDLKTRSMEMERIKRQSNNRSVSSEFTPNFPEIKEDFERMQKLNSEVSSNTSAVEKVNYEYILTVVSEIHRCAVRLNSNLFTVHEQAEKDTENNSKKIDGQDVKNLLDAMDKSINNFVHSSIFRNINVVNTDDSLKAQNELKEIIEISLKVKIRTKKLAKEINKQ